MGRQVLRGAPVVAGVAIGRCWWFRRSAEAERPHADEQAGDPIERLTQARALARAELEQLIASARDRLPASELAILEAQLLMIDDPALEQTYREGIAQGKSPAASWQDAVKSFSQLLSALPDPTLRARAADVEDIGERVLRHLMGDSASPELPPEPVVLCAEDLVPSDVVALPAERIRGLALVSGGPTSHVAILARALGLPTVMQVGEELRAVAEGSSVLLDAYEGQLVLEPDPVEIEEALATEKVHERERQRAEGQRFEPARTRDGYRVEVGANIGRPAEARAAIDAGAEGIGLLRTEFLFVDRDEPPTEEEQERALRAIAEVLGGRPLVVRTLDIGGDKPVPYLPLPKEDNPFLGLRGLRLLRRYEDLLRTQLRVLLRLGYPDLRIMFPMVATVEEFRWARAVTTEVARALEAAGQSIERFQLGMMVEVPAAALLAERFAIEVDFFSIGTNDLTQYVLAADRGHPELSDYQDPLHPAVLRLIDQVCQAAHACGKWVGVCGEAAGDRVAVPVLIGLGVDELSAAPSRVAAIKDEVRRWSREAAQQVARAALNASDAAEVRAVVEQARAGL
ncbi:phosphoenolpyruvate--protein phosphotransferase [Thermomicrobium sp.]